MLRYAWPPKATAENKVGGMISNDCMAVLANAERPVLAHAFINYVLDTKVVLENMSWLGYQPPQKSLDQTSMVDKGLVPETLARRSSRRKTSSWVRSTTQLTRRKKVASLQTADVGSMKEASGVSRLVLAEGVVR